MMITSTMVPQYVDDEDGARRCYPLMAQLRPHLATEDEFVDRWRRQVADGYRLLALLDGPRVIALAGFRVQENLVYGRFLYVDDLVTDGALRGGGYGEQLLTRLKQDARTLRCGKLVLDTPLDNSLGHRFYFRNGLLATSLRFNIAITQ
ncbi:MAG: GNAT family N-acetyltransferase [Acidobacteriaceae bacterium]